MPRYYFNLHAENSHLCDGEGLVLLDDRHAMSRAQQIVREMVATDLRESGEIRLAQSIEVSDQERRRIRLIGFHDIIRIVRG